jgi:hypothetical protein
MRAFPERFARGVIINDASMLMRRRLLALVAAVSMTGCAETLHFSADFERDHGFPAKPSGAPDDSILYPSLTAPWAVRVFHDPDPPLSGDRSLLIFYPGEDRTAYFISQPVPQPTTEPIHFSWLQRVYNFDDVSANSHISIWAGHFSPLVSLELRGGWVFANGSLVGLCYSGLPGPGVLWRIHIEVDPGTDTYGLKVETVGDYRCSMSSSGTIKNPEAFPDRRVGLSAGFYDEERQAYAGYFMDDVGIYSR